MCCLTASMLFLGCSDKVLLTAERANFLMTASCPEMSSSSSATWSRAARPLLSSHTVAKKSTYRLSVALRLGAMPVRKI